MTAMKPDMSEWQSCVADHASEDWGTVCDACLYIGPMYAHIERVEARLAEARGLLVNWMRLHTDDLAASTVPIGLAYQTQCFLAKREVPA